MSDSQKLLLLLLLLTTTTIFIRSQSHFTKMVLHTKELNDRKIITIKSLTNSYLLRELQKVIKREEGKTEKVSHFLIRNFPNKRTLQFG